MTTHNTPVLTGGEVRLAGQGANLLVLKPWEIFRVGVSRTFQNVRLAPGQTMLDNVIVGGYLESRTSRC